jgi:hypothetical protein
MIAPMRTLALVLLSLAWVGCGDNQAPPIDAPTEHMIPADLGMTCAGGQVAGCNMVSSSLGGTCHERCVSAGRQPAICTGFCVHDSDCGSLHCVDIGLAASVCLEVTDPNAGCRQLDAPVSSDASD